MSRTDVHRPYPVQTSDPDNRHRLWSFVSKPWAPKGQSVQLIPLYGTCGCNLCVGQFARKMARRQERVQWRAIRQDLLKTVEEDRDDIDVPPIRNNVL